MSWSDIKNFMKMQANDTTNRQEQLKLQGEIDTIQNALDKNIETSSGSLFAPENQDSGNAITEDAFCGSAASDEQEDEAR